MDRVKFLARTRIGICLGLILASNRAAISEQPSEKTTSVERVSLCDVTEPGEKLNFDGRIIDYQGKPLVGAAVVAYNSDRNGLYVPPESETRIPRIRGVCVTGASGRFAFTTIRPGPYPSGDEPAHIHLVVTAPAHRPRFVTCWFAGDPLITADKRKKAARDPELVIVSLARGAANDWTFTHDIKLEGD